MFASYTGERGPQQSAILRQRPVLESVRVKCQVRVRVSSVHVHVCVAISGFDFKAMPVGIIKCD